MSRNPILARIKLTPNRSVLTKRTPDLLTNLPDRAVWVELLPDCARGREDGGVLWAGER